MPLSVKNHEKNRTVFAKHIDGNNTRIIFEPEGHPGDVQRMPNSVADDIDFLKAIDQGVLEAIGGPQDLLDQINSEVRRSSAQREDIVRRQQAVVEASIDRAADRSMVGAECIAPKNGRPGLSCGRPLLVKRSEVNNHPPLCDEHADLAPTFHLTQVGSKGEGATESREGVIRSEWRQAQMMPASRSDY